MKLIKQYIEYLNAVGKSQGTIKQYENDIKLFEKFYGILNKETIKRVKLEDIFGYLSFLSNKGNTGRTKRRKITVLRSFFNYSKKIGIIKHNVILDLGKESLPKIEKKEPKYFTLDECKRLIDNIPERNKIRNKTIIELFLTTGMRLSELIGLNIDCVRDNQIKVLGKGNKERYVCPGKEMIELLKEYLKIRPEVKTKALFVSERGNRISKTAVQNVLRQCIEAAGLNTEKENDVLVHVLRHTYATLQYQNGTDIRTLQRILGHKNISTTQIYTSVGDKQIIDAAETNPINQII